MQSLVTDIEVGPFKYAKKGLLVLSRYTIDKSPAILVVDPETHERLLTATVFLEKGLPEDEVYIKDWSENEGCVSALLSAGVIEATERFAPAGYEVATCYRLVGRLKTWLKAMYED